MANPSGVVYVPADPVAGMESSVSAVSWGAICGGALVAAATSVVLVALGTGLGLSAISPWPNAGASAATFTIAAGIWLILVQWVSAGLGGFITGRLRMKWVRLHTHEVFFRDTAHGFLTWAAASVLTALLVASAASSVIGTGTRAAASVASGVAQGAASAAQAYDVDTLFRGQKPEAAASCQRSQAEAARILVSGMKDDMSLPDKTYLAGQITE